VTHVPAARAVLEDCRVALADLHAASAENVRHRWFTVVTLLRSVLYVLKNADAADGAASVADAVNANWEVLKQGKPSGTPPIFWEFIDAERQSLVKEYAGTPTRDGIRAVLRPGGVIGTGRSRIVGPKVVAYKALVLAGGPYEHVPMVDVVRLAIEFLGSYLDGVDARLDGEVPLGAP
jgi:hypothetical protein